MNQPSVKTLENAFPTQGKRLRELITSEDAVYAHPAAIRWIRECYHLPSLSELRMHALNAELGFFGVEYVKGKGPGHRTTPNFHYLNSGDSYNATIVRFAGGAYRVTTWGDIVERGNYE
jgi:hypothetical protein